MTRARTIRRMLAACILFVAFSGSVARSNTSSGFTSDKGSFKILVNGQQLGKEEFSIAPGGGAGDWIARGESQLAAADGTKTNVTGTLELRPDGTPVRYEWSTQGAKKASATITFNGPVASIELHVGDARPFTQQLTFGSPQIVILDNNLYSQYAVLAHLYDWQKKGAQTFSVLVPQELTPGTITVESLGSQDVDGKKLDELSVKTEDLEVDVYLDNGRVARIVAPMSNAEIVRE
ncbi:MAG TPA: hypothetical protein VMD78_17595 [Candidatus Baltobacteraceae bacterium]|nr:hypothetical protein [Candidatus Baltobacteraceae bacterium]